MRLTEECKTNAQEQIIWAAYLFLSLPLPLDVSLNVLPDCQLASTLADFSQVSSREALGHLGQVGQVHLLGQWALPEVSLQDGDPAALIWQGDVDQLVQTTRSEDG